MCVILCLCDFQVFYTEVRNGRPLGAASLMEVPLSLDMLTTVSTRITLLLHVCHIEIRGEHEHSDKLKVDPHLLWF